MIDDDEGYDGDGVLSQTVCERCVKEDQKLGVGVRKPLHRAQSGESRWRAAEVGCVVANRGSCYRADR